MSQEMEIASERRMIGCPEAYVRKLLARYLCGSIEARALQEVLCLRETIRRMVERDIEAGRNAD